MSYHIVRTKNGRRCQSSKGKFVKSSRCSGLGGVRGRKHSRKHRSLGLAGVCMVCTVKKGKKVCHKVGKSWPRGKNMANIRGGGVAFYNVKSKRKGKGVQANRFRAAAKQCGHKGKSRGEFRSCMSRVLKGVSSRSNARSASRGRRGRRQAG